MSILLTTLFPAILPALTDGVRGLINKFTGGAGAKPANVEEAIRLMEADTERLKALGELDRPVGEPSQWVTDLRASARYIAVFMILGTWIAATVTLGLDIERLTLAETTYFLVCDLASSAFFYLFGDRVYLHLRKGSGK